MHPAKRESFPRYARRDGNGIRRREGKHRPVRKNRPAILPYGKKTGSPVPFYFPSDTTKGSKAIALALLIAESSPKQKEMMIRLILNLLDDEGT